MGRQTSSCPTRAARVGGMRISVSTTWGSDCLTAESSLGKSVHNASMTTPSYAPSSLTMPLRTKQRVFRHDHPDHHCARLPASRRTVKASTAK